MGSARGCMTTAARRINVELAEYVHRVVSDEKWCIGCKAWHPIDDFGSDASRTDGRAACCRTSKNRRARELYGVGKGGGR
mgnify:CR=1 FL=1